MSIDLGRLVSYLNTYLDVSGFEESAINGLQVAGAKKVEKIAFAVDAALETFEKAAAIGANLLIVHHGIFWGHQFALRGPDYKRIKVLMNHDLALYAAHLPLDAHPEVGHNVALLKALGVDGESLEPFGLYRGRHIGFRARIPETSAEALTQRLSELVGGPVKFLPFGPEKVRQIGCVTGQGADFGLLREAKMAGLHYYISGEANHSIYHFAKENNVAVALAGHYKTEVFGLKVLQSHLEANFEVETHFIDCDTGM